MTIIIYTSKGCAKCTVAKLKMKRLNVHFTEQPIMPLFAETLKSEGFRTLPVFEDKNGRFDMVEFERRFNP